MLAAASLGGASVASANPFPDAVKVDDAALGGMRGGFVLPNGMDVNVGIQIDTRVDGQLALRTVLTLDNISAAKVTVFAPPTPPVIAAPVIATPKAPDAPVIVAPKIPDVPVIATPVITSPKAPDAPVIVPVIAPQVAAPVTPVVTVPAAASVAVAPAEPVLVPTMPATVTVEPAMAVAASASAPIEAAVPAVPSGALSVVASAPPELTGTPVAAVVISSPSPAPPSIQAEHGASSDVGAQMQLAVDASGPSALTEGTSVRVEHVNGGSVVIMTTPTLELQHLVGAATGIFVANTANDRVIDTVATVNIQLGDSAVPIGNTVLQIESIALDAAGRGHY